MKNPDNKPLRIYVTNPHLTNLSETDGMSETEHRQLTSYGEMLAKLAIAESNLIKAGKDSSMPHFIAIVKELERVYGFEFKIIEND